MSSASISLSLSSTLTTLADDPASTVIVSFTNVGASLTDVTVIATVASSRPP